MHVGMLGLDELVAFGILYVRSFHEIRVCVKLRDKVGIEGASRA